MSITELQHTEAPGPNVWKKIENLLAAEARPLIAPVADPMADLLRRARNLWRGAALAAGVAAVAAVVLTVNLRGELEGSRTQLAQLQAQGRDLVRQNTQLVAQLQAQSEIRYVAVLRDDKATPTMLVMFDPKHSALTLKRMGSFQEGPHKSLQLWAVGDAVEGDGHGRNHRTLSKGCSASSSRSAPAASAWVNCAAIRAEAGVNSRPFFL